MALEVLTGQVTDMSLNFSVYFWQSFWKSWHFDTHKFLNLTCIVTCEEKKHTSIDTSEIEMLTYY